MNQRISFLILFLGVMLLSYSCASRNDLVYFQQDSSSVNTAFEMQAPKLQTGDILTISITADNIRATEPYNQVNVYQGGTMQNNHPFIPTYTIEKDGTIDFPQLGKVLLAGKTRVEAINYIKSEVGKFINNPGVNLNIRNFRVSVMGEVVRPGNFLIENDRISILEALSLAGDLTINGVRKNLLVIREENGQKNEYRIDLTKRESLNSPVYFLKQNDVVYVEPNGAKIQSSKYTQNTSIFVSIAGLIITIIAVIVK
ncbi:polysaccharide biosynthesis/export family protein [Sphingobacterium hotanense]|uniref:polysaccharide biosynthesis/export family protein n=1 Tax=Sphingobacterium hotanense TaxID=649196 RepID=UPI0021A9473C|nr:polysaccharide biosynthesis/export family protein [Sphingobacterium hotanense]MCT1523537.1 polysaccharide biosynthesis/export family protein [Sphingobacterium hotanense]